ncbi:MAG: hypothetical protein KJP24_05575 [Sulfurovum sp.]|nr:hypothetical protein [Sulfurovum sp.]MBT8348912.1 hypothetical protein [Sulfurovum sp.]
MIHFVVVKIIPKIIRDTLYDLIAKIRYKLAAKIEDKTCPPFSKKLPK